VKLIAAVLALWALGGEVPAATSAPRPNVILFLTDDQGYGDLACHGNPQVKTPHLDRFAREAVELRQFHVSPVCSPTRASLMTGRYNFRTGVCDVWGQGCNMDPQEVTVAQALQAAGYATGMFGKWHLGDEPQRSPNAHGFQEALTFAGGALPRGQYFDPQLLHNGKKERFEGYCMDIFTDAAIAFIRQNRDRPFFLYLPANLVHVPLVVADDLAAPYDAAGLSNSTAKVYGMLRSIDNNFGRLRALLAELGLEDNTLLIFTSDNGPCSSSAPVDRFMAGLHGLKGTVYENGIRVPCFVRWPARLKAPAQIDRLAAHIDLMPTIVEACDASVPGGAKLDGRSLLPLLRDPTAAWPDRTLFFQWDSGQSPRRGRCFAVLTERWKLVQPAGIDHPNQQHICDRYRELCLLQGRGPRSIEGPPRYELYEIAVDPGEKNDVAADHPQLVEKMRAQYDAWFDDVCARWLTQPHISPANKNSTHHAERDEYFEQLPYRGNKKT
jgi:arylsulfatase A